VIVPWKPGPAERGGEPVVMSVTEFRFNRFRDLPGIFRAGLAFRRSWGRRPGAIGLALYVNLMSRRLGSISAWRDEADLRRFVALPIHVAIMRRYRSRGVVRSATWRADACDPQRALAHAREEWAKAQAATPS
jgi:hypothetical protein